MGIREVDGAIGDKVAECSWPHPEVQTCTGFEDGKDIPGSRSDGLHSGSGRCIGLPADTSEANCNLRTLAEAGLAKAQVQLALALAKGEGTSDLQEAVAWMQRAAEKGDPEAMYKLGVALLMGRGIEKDPQRSTAWIAAAAHKGFAEAQNALGVAHLAGEGVEHNLDVAIGWFRLAAASGDARAQCNLGVAYIQGLGDLLQDYTEAQRLFSLAAAQGSPDGMYNLSLMHAKGLLVPQDADAAYRRCRCAAQQGHRQAATLMQHLEKLGASPAAIPTNMRTLARGVVAPGPCAMLCKEGQRDQRSTHAPDLFECVD